MRSLRTESLRCLRTYNNNSVSSKVDNMVTNPIWGSVNLLEGSSIGQIRNLTKVEFQTSSKTHFYHVSDFPNPAPTHEDGPRSVWLPYRLLMIPKWFCMMPVVRRHRRDSVRMSRTPQGRDLVRNQKVSFFVLNASEKPIWEGTW